MSVFRKVLLLYGAGSAAALLAVWLTAARPAVFSVVAGGSVLAVLALIGWVTVGRELRAEAQRRSGDDEYRDQQRDLAEAMQMIRTEAESHVLIKRYLERLLRGASVVILGCNNSENRLLPATDLDGDAELAVRLAHAEPESCLAVRSGRSHRERAGEQQLLSCELCGGRDRSSTCIPALVGGEVIGSILVSHDRPLGKTEWRRAIESISQTAPSLANLRTLAIAEVRAATDPLTGLPNRRTLDDTLKRTLAQAGRTMTPLSAILFDLDDFKKINDVHGHEKGDEVLAAVGAVVSTTIRQSDMAGRSGGEEFLVILPDTDRHGALRLAEKLRLALTRIAVIGVEQPITGSFGAATYPDDGTDPGALVRSADRALYRAKTSGKNRVEVAVAAGDPRELETSSGSVL
jgi:diguanylate cyclase (GGDEF)-like protein